MSNLLFELEQMKVLGIRTAFGGEISSAVRRADMRHRAMGLSDDIKTTIQGGDQSRPPLFDVDEVIALIQRSKWSHR